MQYLLQPHMEQPGPRGQDDFVLADGVIDQLWQRERDNVLQLNDDLTWWSVSAREQSSMLGEVNS